LHDHAHAKLFGLSTTGRLVGLPLKLHLATGGGYKAADDFRQRAFARAVFAGQGKHFPTHQRQVNVAEYGLSVGFANTADR